MSKIELLPHQEIRSTELRFNLLSNGVSFLMGEVRSGKTLTSLAAIHKLYKEKNEAHTNVLFVTTLQAKKDVDKVFKEIGYLYNLVTINYGSVHKIPEPKHGWDAIILDESHKLGAFPKPPKIHSIIKNIVSHNERAFLILMSGTPADEGWSRLFHQFSITPKNPFIGFSNFYKWAKEFVNVKQVYINSGRPKNCYKDAKKDKIKNITDKYTVFITQEEAGIKKELQATNKQVIIKSKPITDKLINLIIKDRVIEGKNNCVTADTGAKLMSKLHQFAGGTIKFDDETSKLVDNSKILHIEKEYINKGKKVAILTTFKQEEEAVFEHFKDRATQDYLEFNEKEGLIFIGNITRFREGVNLSSADYLFFYNTPHSSISYTQARNRMTNVNRKKKNEVIFLHFENGIDRKIYDVVVQKNKSYGIQNFRKDYNIKKEITQSKLF